MVLYHTLSRYVPSSFRTASYECQSLASLFFSTLLLPFLLPLPHRSILGKLTLVDHVPVRALPLVATGHGVDVVGHDLDERGVVEVALLDPRRELAVPDERVAPQVLAVLDRPVDVAVGVVKGEDAALRLGRLPLQRVLGRDGADLEVVLEDGVLEGLVAQSQGGADVLLALGLDGRVKADATEPDKC